MIIPSIHSSNESSVSASHDLSLAFYTLEWKIVDLLFAVLSEISVKETGPKNKRRIIYLLCICSTSDW